MRWGLRRRSYADQHAPATEERLIGSMVETIESPVVVTNRRLQVIGWNAAMERFTGRPRADALSRTIDQVLPWLVAVDLPRHMREAVDGKATRLSDVPYEISLGGPTGWLDARCVPLHGAGGQVTAAVGYLTDVTDRRRQTVFLQAVEAIARSLTSSLDLNEVLDTIAGRAMEVMVAEAALIASWDGEANEFRVMRTIGRLSAAYSASGSMPVAGGPISRALLESRPVTTTNILSDPRLWLSPERRMKIEREGFKAVAAAPLVSKGRVHGALVVHYWNERTFTDDERTALALFAEQAAVAIDGAQLYADATRRAERLRELAELERVVAESLDLDDVLHRIADATARLVGAPVVQVWTADPGARRLHRRAESTQPGISNFEPPVTVEFGEGVTGQAAETRASVFVPDARWDSRVAWPAFELDAAFGTMLAVPIIAGESLLGVLTVHAPTGTLSADEDQALVTSFASQAALAMQNARTYTDAVRRASRLRDLVAVSQSVTASLDMADVVQRVANAAASMAPGALAAVHTLDADRGVLQFAGTSGADWEHMPRERPATSGLPGLVVEQRGPVLVREPLAHARTLARDWWQRRPAATYYGVPIMVGDNFVGVLDYIQPSGLPDVEQQEALRLLAAHAGVAIRNAWLYQAERVQAERIRALTAINRRLSSALELDELLQTISESAAQLAGVRFVSFWRAEEGHRRLSFVGGSVPEIAADFPEPTVSYDAGGIGWVARHQMPLDVDDVFGDPSVPSLDWWQRWGLRSFAGYPVLAGKELLAILSLSHSEPIRYSADTRDVIDMFIAQASVAIQNARLYRDAQRRREVAEALARLGRELTGLLDAERIAHVVTRGITELLSAQISDVFIHEPEDGTLHSFASFGRESDLFRAFVMQAGEGVVGRAVAERRLVSSPDLLNAPDIQLSSEARQRIEQLGFRSAIALPLIAQDRVVGALALGAERGREFTLDDRQALQVFADQAALALENARLYARARESLKRLRETQAQLVQAGKLSALGQLVSGVAHELNNPLSVIIGYGQLLLGREMSDQVRHPVELMVAQGDRMAKIVRNLLYFARQRPPERAPVGLHQVIEQTLALRLNQLALSGIVVEKDFAPNLAAINGDAQQLQQVFLNLLLNAEQAIASSGRGSGRIVFRTRMNGNLVCAEVTDDGPGIPAADLTRVFEPFFTTKEVGVGTGLGLSVSYGIIEEHGGRLSVESEPGKTVFTMEVPVGVFAAEGTTDSSKPTAPSLSAEGRVALVVEDEPSVLELIVTLLRGTGWRVDVASGGRAALERVRTERYDLVVSDIRMPDGSGDEFYRRATAQDPELAGRFVFMTGDTANPDAWRSLKDAKLTVLEKPFQPSLFLEAVHRVAMSLTASGSGA